MEYTGKRNPILALVLSLFVPGLGQLYNGQQRKGIALYLICCLMISIFFTGLYSKFYFLVLFITLTILYVLFAIVDAYYQAARTREITPRHQNRWYVYAAIVFCHLSISALFINSELIPVKIYRIASDSMAPTLLPGDYFLVDKKHYNVEQPQRGDIIVFRSPADNSIDFIKRVVGLPGETLEIVNHKVFINREPLIERYIGTAGKKPLLTGRNSGPFEIPADGVFVLGDNRGDSYDSRHYRYVNLSAIHGKALYLIWTDDAKRIGKKLG